MLNIGLKQFQALGAVLGDGLLIGTADGEALAATPCACQLLGLPPDASPQRVAERLAALIGAPPLQLAARGPFTRANLRFAEPDGPTHRLRVAGLALDPAGETVAIVVSELGRLPPLAEPPELDPEIRRLHQLRDEILSIASHELKNPLTVILGYSRLLAADRQVHESPRLARAAEAIRQQSQRMRRMVEQLLDFARLGLGQLTLQHTPFDLAEQVRTVAEHHSTPRFPLQIATPPEPLPVLGDPMRVERVLATLLSDALTHDQHPRAIQVSVRRVDGAELPEDAYGGPAETAPYGLVSIHDPSLPPAALDHRSFTTYVAMESWDTPQSDHWLGLYVGAQVLALHGGLIWAEQADGPGGLIAYALPLMR